jgi:hypothetical protein
LREKRTPDLVLTARAGEFDASSGAQPQSQWRTGTFDYTVFYSADGHVEQAYVNPLAMRGQTKAFDCPLVRIY